MTESEINLAAYNLVNLLEINERKTFVPLIEKEDFIGVTHLDINGHSIDMPISHLSDTFGNIHAVKKDINDNEVGLSRENYKELQNIANYIIEIPYFNTFTDYQFIEIEIFRWIIEIYETNFSKSDLLNYLKNEVEKELYDYQFYYKIASLGIEQDFVIANIQFTSLNREFFKKEFAKQNQKYEDYEEHLNTFTNRVIAVSKSYATKNRAEKKSISDVKLAINTLRIFMLLESIDTVKLPYLDDDSNKSFLFFLFKKTPDSFFGFQFNSGNRPAIVNIEMLSIFKQMGLDIVSHYIKNQKDNELYYEIIDKINYLGETNANDDFYERSVRIVSFFESFLIPDGNTKSKGITYLKNIAKRFWDDEDLIKVIIEIYDVRDKFLHNRIEKKITPMSFHKIQYFALAFILELIELNKQYSSRNEVLEFWGIENKLKKK